MTSPLNRADFESGAFAEDREGQVRLICGPRVELESIDIDTIESGAEYRKGSDELKLRSLDRISQQGRGRDLL